MKKLFTILLFCAVATIAQAKGGHGFYGYGWAGHNTIAGKLKSNNYKLKKVAKTRQHIALKYVKGFPHFSAGTGQIDFSQFSNNY
jgi:hypothetical protein